MGRKALVLGLAVAQLAVFGTLIGLRVADWSRSGWAGFAYGSLRDQSIAEAKQGASQQLTRPRRVTFVAPRSPAERSGIREGDLIEAVEGIPVADSDRLAELSTRIRVGHRLTYRLEAPDGPREVAVALESPYRSPYVAVAQASTVVAGLTWLLISLLVAWGRPESRSAVVFFLMCTSGAAVHFVWAVGELDLPDLRGIVPLGADTHALGILLALILLSVAFANLVLHLALVFPAPRPVVERWPQVFRWLHAAPFWPFAALALVVATVLVRRSAVGVALYEAAAAATAVWLSLRLARRIRSAGWLATFKASPAAVLGLALVAYGQLGLVLRLLPDRFALILGISFGVGTALSTIGFVLAYSALTCVALYRSFRESGVEVRTQVRWPLWGTLTAIGGTGLLSIMSVAFTFLEPQLPVSAFTFAAATNTLTKLLYLLIPISFAFAIVKYRLLDIEVLIRKTVVYSGVTGFILAVYLVLAGVSGLALVRSAGFESQAATVVATLAVVVLFVPVRNRIQGFVDRRFFRRERSYDEMLRRIDDQLLRAPELGPLLPELAEQLQQTVQARSVAVFVRPPGGDRLVVEATVGLPERTSSGLALDAAGPILRGDDRVVHPGRLGLEAEDQRLVRRMDAAIALVARRGCDPLAVIGLGPKLTREPYDAEDEGFLGAVADQLAAAIGRLREGRAQDELDQARAIQRSLLPASIPQIAGVEVASRWQPAREVGGDYYDVLALDEQRLALCIGDVVGKGMPAALLMSSLQAAVKAVASADVSPARLCEQVRTVVRASLSGGKFVTFFYGVVDHEAGLLRYANAGHNPPILARGDGTLVRLDVGGPAIARLLADLPYHQADIPLRSGDRLLLYTDGVTEASDPRGEPFGEGRLEQLVRVHPASSAGELERAVAEAVLAHAAGALQDDLTVVTAVIG